MKIIATAIGGPEDGKKLTGHDSYRLLYIHQSPRIQWNFPKEPPSLMTHQSSCYRLEQFQYSTSGIEILEFNFWVSEDLTNYQAMVKIMEGYGAMSVSGIEGTPNQKYRETLRRESGIFDNRPNPLLNIKGKEGVVRTNLNLTPEMVEKAADYPIVQSEEKDDYDPWDSKNWGL